MGYYLTLAMVHPIGITIHFSPAPRIVAVLTVVLAVLRRVERHRLSRRVVCSLFTTRRFFNDSRTRASNATTTLNRLRSDPPPPWRLNGTDCINVNPTLGLR
jgi:hypothetical protein